MSDFIREWFMNFLRMFIRMFIGIGTLAVIMGLTAGIGIWLAETYNIWLGIFYIVITLCLFFAFLLTIENY